MFLKLILDEKIMGGGSCQQPLKFDNNGGCDSS